MKQAIFTLILGALIAGNSQAMECKFQKSASGNLLRALRTSSTTKEIATKVMAEAAQAKIGDGVPAGTMIINCGNDNSLNLDFEGMRTGIIANIFVQVANGASCKYGETASGKELEALLLSDPYKKTQLKELKNRLGLNHVATTLILSCGGESSLGVDMELVRALLIEKLKEEPAKASATAIANEQTAVDASEESSAAAY